MALEYIYPVAKYLTITQIYHSGHKGVDMGWTAAYSNQPIVAAEAGTVVTAVDGYGNTYPNKKIYGNYVIIKHSDGNYTVYGHLLKGSVCVKKNQKVAKGQQVGQMGNTGYSMGQHLHFEFRKGGNTKSRSIDPFDILMIEGDTPIVSPKTKVPEKILHRKMSYGTPVPRNLDVDQIEVTSKIVNARKEPGTSAEILGSITPGIYNALSTTSKDGYRWYQTDEFWCARVSGVTFLPRKVKEYSVEIPKMSEEQYADFVKFAEEKNITYSSKQL